MTEISFIDTNILIYARDPRVEHKRLRASELIRRLWNEKSGRIGMQVLSEYYAVVTRKLKMLDAQGAWDDVLAFMAWNPQPVDRNVVTAARVIESRYATSWWDALVVAAAQLQHCTILHSEDFQDGMIFGQLTVHNPFAGGVQEPPARHAGPVVPRSNPRHRSRGRPAQPR